MWLASITLKEETLLVKPYSQIYNKLWIALLLYFSVSFNSQDGSNYCNLLFSFHRSFASWESTVSGNSGH